MRALYSGVTGIRSHQVRMDVIGNNIANVNTTGFKSSRVTFQDVFSQTLSSGSQQSAPQQVGLGVGIASTDLIQDAGSFQLTGRELDLAIEGSGMFVLKGLDGTNSFTRAGNFDWDSEGNLVVPGTGTRIQGWLADPTGEIANTTPANLDNIKVVKGSVALAETTASATLGGNLDAGAADGDTFSTTFTSYDSLNRPQPIVLTFTKSASNQWAWAAEGPAGTTTAGSGNLTFGTDGMIQAAGQTGTVTISPTGASNQTVQVDFRALSQAFSGSSSNVIVRKADGNPMGSLESVSIDPNGVLFGLFSNGFRRPLAQVALANFANPSGLLKSGSNGLAESAASGTAVIGKPNSSGWGRLVPGNLEMSNVDLSTEFTTMITTQRGFQANTRIISTADEMLQDLVNLRR